MLISCFLCMSLTLWNLTSTHQPIATTQTRRMTDWQNRGVQLFYWQAISIKRRLGQTASFVAKMEAISLSFNALIKIPPFTCFRTDPVLTRMDICQTNLDLDTSVWEGNTILHAPNMNSTSEICLNVSVPVSLYSILSRPKHVCSIYFLSMPMLSVQKAAARISIKLTVNFILYCIHTLHSHYNCAPVALSCLVLY
jgi:hypothetical protein